MARFIGVMNVLECEVRGGMAKLNELEFPAHGVADGQKLRLGFRPYSVQISPELGAYRYQGVLRHTYFLGIMLRLEVELPSGLILRSRMTKEEYARLNLWDGVRVSFQIRNYRVLGSDDGKLSAEVSVSHQMGANLGEGI